MKCRSGTLPEKKATKVAFFERVVLDTTSAAKTKHKTLKIEYTIKHGEIVSILLELKCIFEISLVPISQLHKTDHPDIRQGDNNLMEKYIKHFVQKEQNHDSLNHSI